MIPRYGIDTSILVRLMVGEPPEQFELCVERLEALVADEDAEVFASNQVIGEAYVAVQHHYGVSKANARHALATVLQSGFVLPLRGRPVLDALAEEGGCGLFDRLIVIGHHHEGLATLTLDERMAGLASARLLR